MNDAYAWGGSQDMSVWEALMWRSESDPRTRSTGILPEILDGEPDWERFLVGHDRATRHIPRLRERVVEPHVPLVQPAWSLDVHFDLNDHVQRMRPHEPGTHRQLLDLCESIFKRPLDRARPPWESILVTGLEGGRSAYLFKFHHSMADGLGLMQLLDLAHSDTRKPSNAPLEKAHVRGPVLTSTQLLSSRIRARMGSAPSTVTRRGRSGLRALGRTATHPVETVNEGLRFSKSLGRMLAAPAEHRSPLLANTGVTSRLLTLEAPLDDLKTAGKSAGGSVNDAYIAAVLGGLRRYHEHHDAMVDTIPIGMPVSLRKANEPLGGNKFAGARFGAPLAEPDPAVRIQSIRTMVQQIRSEPAIGFLDHLSPVLTKLPSAAIIELSAGLTTSSDLNISNIPGSPRPAYLAGCEVLGMYPLGPRPGVAVMAAMITCNGTCCIGLNVDARVFADLEVPERCLREGFDEVLALARPRPRKGSQARQRAEGDRHMTTPSLISPAPARVADPKDGAIRAAERVAYAHYGLTPAERWVRVDTGCGHVEVRLTEFGEDQTEVPVLLLHGVASASVLGAALVRHLTGRRVIAVDWPGHGLSGPCVIPSGLGIRTHATTTLTAVLDALGLDRVDLVGHSLGAQFSLYAAHDLGPRIRRIVLAGAPGAAIIGVKPVTMMKVLATPGVGRALLAGPLSERTFCRNQDLTLGPGALDDVPPKLLEAAFLLAGKSSNAASIASFFRALIRRGSVRAGVGLTLDELGRIQQPALLAWGDQDVFPAPVQAASSIVALRDVRLLRLATAGHAPWLQADAQVGTAIAAHLAA